ncbi:MAG TPA: hypothetical protein VKR31_00775 [Rhizomicrobium sp.]|nr:hypothetical protein [Rhizomicrobium sp.]
MKFRAPKPSSDLLLDFAGILGALLVVAGAALIYPPSAFVVAGAFLLIGRILIARNSASSDRG